MKIALITTIESNLKCTNDTNGITFHDQRLYEDEAIICFKSWRENGGWLKDIAIYAYCPTKNTISESTKTALKELNVTYIEKFHEETTSFSSGFVSVPFTGMLLEKELEEDIFIHTDLDMSLIKPIEKELISEVFDSGVIVCGQCDDVSKLTQRNLGPDWQNPVDTGFIISRRDSGFYKYYYENLLLLHESKGDERWRKYCADVQEYYLEEYVIDIALNTNTLPIKPVQYYQVGEGYASITTFPKENLDSIYFWHEHINHCPSYDKIREKINYFKRMKEITNG